MANEQARALIAELGNLSAQRKVIEDIISKKQDQLVEILKTQPELMKTIECERCKGTGDDSDGMCISCNGEGERYIFDVPSETGDMFSCKVYEVSQRIANQTKARKLLRYNTFNAIFKAQGHRRVDVRPTAEGRASIGESNG